MGDWVLGIDFGTSYTAAAFRAGDRSEILELGGQRRIPSVVLVDEDGSILVGNPAESLSATRPTRALREPKRRIGERTPVVLGGEAYSVTDLVAAVLANVYAEAVRHQGSPPSEVRLTHPATWGRARVEDLRQAAIRAGLPTPEMVPESVAAAAAYYVSTAGDGGPVRVAVYDLGGGTLDTTILRHTDEGFVIEGRPGGDPRLGGELFDEILVDHILGQLPEELVTELATSDEIGWRQAAASLREKARVAKELLSEQPYAEVLVTAPTGFTQVTVTRSELEGLIEPYISRSIDVLRRDLSDAGLDAGDLDAVYLVGGGSRMPIVERMVAAGFPGVDVSRRNDPKLVVALGATLPEAMTALGSTAPDEVPAPEPSVPDGPAVTGAATGPFTVLGSELDEPGVVSGPEPEPATAVGSVAASIAASEPGEPTEELSVTGAPPATSLEPGGDAGDATGESAEIGRVGRARGGGRGPGARRSRRHDLRRRA